MAEELLPRPGPLTVAWERLKQHPLANIGPGLITGVADDDPSGIATYSQAGAQFGFDMLWTMPLAFPLMAAIQSLCARIGRVTGRGLAANIKMAFPPIVVRTVVALLLVANTLNIAADLAAMGEVSQMVIGLDRHLMTVVFVIISLGLQIFVPYHRYVAYLKWLTLSLVAYVLVLFVVHVPWGEVGAHLVWPRFKLDGAAAATITGVLGTTISPYLFFWQASEEVEEMQAHRGRALTRDGRPAGPELRRIRWDTWTGMFYSDLIAFFVILAAAVTLHVAGVTNINSAADAARALKPIAGDFAYLVFALGILGVGMIGVPVLAGSGAYALAEAMGWHEGLERRTHDARGFYGVIAVSVLLAVALQYSPIDPMKALFWSAVINGVVAAPLMAVVVLLASNRRMMGDYPASRTLKVLGWIATGVMSVAVVAMFIPGGH